MNEQVKRIIKLLQEDPRYTIEAYQFVRDGLAFAQEILKLGKPDPAASAEEQEDAAENDNEDEVEFEEQETTEPERHLTGQELSEAIRQYAIDQYGFLAKQVLNSWGLHTTGDFGEVVYNLIRVGLMKKSSEDRREDFDDCFDFEQAFVKKFRFVKPAKI